MKVAFDSLKAISCEDDASTRKCYSILFSDSYIGVFGLKVSALAPLIDKTDRN